MNANIKQEPGSIALIELWSMQLWDGGDLYYHEFYMTSQKAADEFIRSLGKNKHFYRADKVVLKVADSGQQWMNYKQKIADSIRQAALEKLTIDEKMALGINE